MSTEKRFPFTQDRLAKLVCPPSGRPQQDGRAMFYDAKVAGLAFRVSEGGVRAFYWTRRVGPKVRYVKIGAFPELNVEQARRRAGEFNDGLARGIDPAAAKQAKREKELREATIANLWESYRDHWLAYKKPKTVAEFTRLYDAHIAPWSRHTIASITPADVERLKVKIGAESQSTANRVVEVISAMYRRRGHAFGLARGYSPTTGVDPYPEKVRDRVLSTEELAKVMKSIDADEHDVARDYFRMLIYTGARRNNVACMTWDDLNIDGGTWKLPGEKTKNGQPLVISLIPEALAIIKRRYESNPADSPFVFPSRNFTPAQIETAKTMRADGSTTRQIAAALDLSQTAVMHILSPLFKQRGASAYGGAGKAWQRIMQRAGIPKTTIHDIRRSFCTSLIERGVPLPIVAAAMGHRNMGTTQRHYAFASDKAVADATRTSMAGLLADVAKSQEKNAAKKTA